MTRLTQAWPRLARLSLKQTTGKTRQYYPFLRVRHRRHDRTETHATSETTETSNEDQSCAGLHNGNIFGQRIECEEILSVSHHCRWHEVRTISSKWSQILSDADWPLSPSMQQNTERCITSPNVQNRVSLTFQTIVQSSMINSELITFLESHYQNLKPRRNSF